MNWTMAGAIMAFCTLLGAILIAAAKSVFVTKKQIYDDTGLPLFITQKDFESKLHGNYTAITKIDKKIDEILGMVVPRPEWEDSKRDRAVLYNTQQENICRRMEELMTATSEMKKGQIAIGLALAEIQTVLKTFPRRKYDDTE